MTGRTDDKGAPANPGRRSLIKSTVVGAAGAAALGSSLPSRAQSAKAAPTPDPAAVASRAAADGAAEVRPPNQVLSTVANPGSDYMVDVIKSLDIDYVAANPGSSFRGLHESILNHGGNKKPEFITCLHEEVSVSMAHGYALASGKPMLNLIHATVGLQHASMAVYNAFADRAPVLMITAANRDGAHRRPNAEWLHSAQDGASLVRDITKWDDQPGSLQHFGNSMIRAHQLAMSAPRGPVLLAADMDLQEEAVSDPRLFVPKQTPQAPVVASPETIDEVARLLVTAENPVLVAERYAQSDQGMGLLITLAELLNVPVLDMGSRFNFPSDHYLNQRPQLRQLVSRADVIVGLDLINMDGALGTFHDGPDRHMSYFARSDAKIVTLGHDDILRSNYQDFMRYVAATLHVPCDAEATMPLLIEAVKRQGDAASKTVIDQRGESLRRAHEAVRARDAKAARIGWTASPVTTARLTLELWDVIKDENWAFVSGDFCVSNWPQRLLPLSKPHHFAIATPAAGGMGGAFPRGVGAALAYRERGLLPVAIQPDGDMLYTNGALWTAAHHKIPMLIVVHNNRAYHQETMHLLRMAAERERNLEQARIGTQIDDPNIDFATMARSMGVYGIGPISSPADLRPALIKALAVVKRGEPAVVDVVTQPR